MRALRLIGVFIKTSAQAELAYRANFFIQIFYSLLNLAMGVLALVILFSQVESVQGWDFASTLALLGVYLLLAGLRGLFIGPSLEALAGLGREIWSGAFDFVLLRPVDAQFLASLRYWRLFSLFDLALGLAVVVMAASQPGQSPGPAELLAFAASLCAGVAILYAILLAFTALVFWSPGFLFTWVFDGIFQMARYPVGLYPGLLRMVLTWVAPVGVMTTFPAQALTGALPLPVLLGSLALAAGLVAAASALFRAGLRRYASASS